MAVVGGALLFLPSGEPRTGPIGGFLTRLGLSAPVAVAADPPAGFRRLFNDQDLAGWHGMGHFDPYKLESLPAEEREK